jgi:predicted nucleic acid-binding protein
MESIIFDASTLILLAKIDLLGSLTAQVQVAIPEAVRLEATRRHELPDAKLIERLIRGKEIKVLKVKKEKTFMALVEKDFLLGKGESQAIALAKAKNVLLGIDDRQGIKACKVLGLRFTTALAFIVRFHEKGILTTGQAIAKVERLRRYGWYREEILAKILEEIQRRDKK